MCIEHAEHQQRPPHAQMQNDYLPYMACDRQPHETRMRTRDHSIVVHLIELPCQVADLGGAGEARPLKSGLKVGGVTGSSVKT